jgi:hypothetical protein
MLEVKIVASMSPSIISLPKAELGAYPKTVGRHPDAAC